MKVLPKSFGETQSKEVKALPSFSHELPMEPRAKEERCSGKHNVHTHFPKDRNCDICLKTKMTRASCRRRAGTGVPRAEHFGDFITADHKVISEESDSRNDHRYAVMVQNLATHGYNHTRVKLKLLGKRRRAYRSSWIRRRNPKSFTLTIPWNLACVVRNFPGSLYVNTTQIRNEWDCREQCAE